VENPLYEQSIFSTDSAKQKRICNLHVKQIQRSGTIKDILNKE